MQIPQYNKGVSYAGSGKCGLNGAYHQAVTP